MKKQVEFDNMEFGLDHDFIHCKFKGKLNKTFLQLDMEDIIIEVVPTLSEINYKPIIFDLTQISKLDAVRVFKILSRNSNIKLLVLSKSFLVKSFDLKLLFDLCSFKCGSVVPNKVFTSYSQSVKFCSKDYEQFNACY